MTTPVKASNAEFNLNPWSLRFRDREEEHAFLDTYNNHIVSQSRLGLILGITVFSGMGLTDWLFFDSGFYALWTIRLVVAALMGTVLALSFRWEVFHRLGQWLLSAAALSAACGVIGLNLLGSEEVHKAYYMGMLLVVVWSYGMSGLRFIFAFYVNACILAMMAVSCLYLTQLPLNWLFVHGLLILAISAVAGSASYAIERQRRLLFLYTRDLDQERRQYKRSASHDHLTGLPNRRHFEQQLEATLVQARRRQETFALLFVDINRFKPVNDQYGHDVGDQLLKVIAQRLAGNMRQDDFVARLAGDEFVILLSGPNSVSTCDVVAQKLISAIADPVHIQHKQRDVELRVTASVGIACYPGDGSDPEKLIRKADHAMYTAKAAGESCFRHAGDLTTQMAG